MADGSLEVIEEFDFHPCDTPRGSLYYDLKVLTDEQQRKLNDLKTKVIREDEIYLAEHPEIRAIIVLILRHVLKYQPRKNLNHFIAYYFLENAESIQEEIESYLTGRKSHVYRGDSAVVSEPERSEETLVDLEQVETDMEEVKRREEIETIATEVLTEIIENIVGKVEECDRGNVEFVKQLITEEIVDKVGDRMKEDFKNFLIEELLKRITSDTFDSHYGDVTFEDNVSNLFIEDYNAGADAVVEPEPTLVDEQEAVLSAEGGKEEEKQTA